MSYIVHDKHDVDKMLSTIGVSNIDELFNIIPSEHRLGENDLNISAGISEQALRRKVENIASMNKVYDADKSFLGAGVYNHYVPSVVNHIASRSEFYTAYTPYQPEVSQGTLTAIFEFQTFMTRLTGMDVSNASMYDGATALAEAVLMAYRVKRKKKNVVLVPSNLHPEYLKVLISWLEPFNLIIKTIKSDLNIDLNSFKSNLDEALCFIAQSPNFYGYIEDDLDKLINFAREKDVISVFLNIDPSSLALFKSPRELGFDLCVLEIQGLGNYTSFGGPHAGVITGTNSFAREFPGRIVGETIDTDGKRTFVLTMCTREQHIRREKATSNICSNQALIALRTCVYLSLLGGDGLKDLSLTNYNNSKNLAHKLASIAGLSVDFTKDFYNEFVVKFLDEKSLEKVIFNLKKNSINPGYKIDKNKLLVCVTEQNSNESIDKYYNLVLESV